MNRDIDVAWAAGFFDGEGWVKIQKRASEKYTGFYLRVGINHVALPPIKKIQRIFGGHYRLDEGVKGNRKPRYVWTLSTNEAKDALEEMFHYLANKQEVAELGLEFCDTIQNKGQRVSEDTQLYRFMLAERIKYLNTLD